MSYVVFYCILIGTFVSLGFETFKFFHISDKIPMVVITEYVDGKVTNADKFCFKISKQNFHIVLRKLIEKFSLYKMSFETSFFSSGGI